MEDNSNTQERQQYLNQIDQLYRELNLHSETFHREHDKIIFRLANVIEEARLECDLGMIDVARHRGISRQAVHKVIKKAFGVRHEDKAEAAKKGHLLKQQG